MKKIYIIAHNTFLESVRTKVLYALLIFAFVVIATSGLLGGISAGEDHKVIRDVGLSTIAIFGILISVFVGTNLVYNEIERRTIYNIISKPVSRYQYFLGKYLGLSFTLFVIVFVMSVVLVGYLLIQGVPIHLGLFQAICLEFVAILLITAFTVFFSAITTPILSAVFTLCIYAVGSVIHTVDFIKGYSDKTGETVITLFDILKALVPNLDNFIRAKVRVAHGLNVPAGEFFYSLLYGGLYITAVLVLGLAIFQRRNF